MYYLLESSYSKVWDERIVSDNELLEQYSEYESFCKLKLEIYKNPSDRLELHVKGIRENGSKFFISNKGLIKKQSENVFDLIEVGDLVNLDKTLNQVIAILKEDKRTIFEIGDNKWFSYKELNNYLNNNLFAIYKPDANGNYIKVWDKKGE